MANQWIRFTDCLACAIDLKVEGDYYVLTMFLPEDFAEMFGIDSEKTVERTYLKKMFIADNESRIWDSLCTFDGKKSFDVTSQATMLRQQIDKLNIMNISLQSTNRWLETEMKKALTRPEEFLKRAKSVVGAEPSRVISGYGTGVYPPFYGTLGGPMPGVNLRRSFDEGSETEESRY